MRWPARPLMATQAIREDDARGRHTTTHRQLVLLPSGRLVLDTPGMRELGSVGCGRRRRRNLRRRRGAGGACRFRDCAHETEPGCAVQAALADGSLDAGRWRSYVKLQRELAHLARKDDPRERAEAAQGLDPARPGTIARRRSGGWRSELSSRNFAQRNIRTQARLVHGVADMRDARIPG